MENPSPYPRPGAADGGPVCPQCSSPRTSIVKYTWWGGLLAPKLMKLTKCEDCRFLFNRQTGKSSQTAIWVYNLVGLVVGLVAMVFAYRFAFNLFR